MSMGRTRRQIPRFVKWVLCVIPFGIVWYLRVTNRIAVVPSGIGLLVCILLMFTVMDIFDRRTRPRRPRRPRRPARPIRPLPLGVILTQAVLLLAASVVVVAELLRLRTASLSEHLVACGLALALLGVVWATFHRFGIL